MKNVKLEEYFVDKELFLNSIKTQMSNKDKGGYTDQEIYRLKKVAT